MDSAVMVSALGAAWTHPTTQANQGNKPCIEGVVNGHRLSNTVGLPLPGA